MGLVMDFKALSYTKGMPYVFLDWDDSNSFIALVFVKC
jgi:hypothetical protein